MGIWKLGKILLHGNSEKVFPGRRFSKPLVHDAQAAWFNFLRTRTRFVLLMLLPDTY